MGSTRIGVEYVDGPMEPNDFDTVEYRIVSQNKLLLDRTGYRGVIVEPAYPPAKLTFIVYDAAGRRVATKSMSRGVANLCRWLADELLIWKWDGRLSATGERAAVGTYFVDVHAFFIRKCAPSLFMHFNTKDPLFAVTNPETTPGGPGTETVDAPDDLPEEPSMSAILVAITAAALAAG